jgi:[FeFe] hydrogenase H-cluster maturation GTPase HydF
MIESINTTPKSSRLHIGIFGRRNAGKSSLINALTRQNAALVSPTAGTTTDPVFKAMELLPIGPVVIIDTAGLDDEGELGEMRVERTFQVLNSTDLALLVIDAMEGAGKPESEAIQKIKAKKIPVIGVLNKSDVKKHTDEVKRDWQKSLGTELIEVSTATGEGISELLTAIIRKAPEDNDLPSLVEGLVSPGDVAVLVVPIDKAAPKGRLILPQQQVIREILDKGAIAIVTRQHELRETLKKLYKPPAIVITDSQEFKWVEEITPKEIPLTSFSILLARQKGDLGELKRGVEAIDKLKPGDRVLIAEACTHHRQDGDIGTVKIPRWLNERAGGRLNYEWTSGMSYPKDIDRFKLIVHCGACMINRREMMYRISLAKEKGIPIVNYGLLIAHLTDNRGLTTL